MWTICRAFGLGLSLVALVAANSIQVNHGRYPGAFLVGCVISLIWASGVNQIVGSGKWVKIAYCLGAGCGTVLGMLITDWFYHP